MILQAAQNLTNPCLTVLDQNIVYGLGPFRLVFQQKRLNFHTKPVLCAAHTIYSKCLSKDFTYALCMGLKHSEISHISGVHTNV